MAAGRPTTRGRRRRPVAAGVRHPRAGGAAAPQKSEQTRQLRCVEADRRPRVDELEVEAGARHKQSIRTFGAASRGDREHSDRDLANAERRVVHRRSAPGEALNVSRRAASPRRASM